MEVVKRTSYQSCTGTMEKPLIDSNWRDERHDKHYGMVDLRETQLIAPDWREQPMRAWDDVYEELCREVGSAYGLNDIREA